MWFDLEMDILPFKTVQYFWGTQLLSSLFYRWLWTCHYGVDFVFWFYMFLEIHLNFATKTVSELRKTELNFWIGLLKRIWKIIVWQSILPFKLCTFEII